MRQSTLCSRTGGQQGKEGRGRPMTLETHAFFENISFSFALIRLFLRYISVLNYDVNFRLSQTLASCSGLVFSKEFAYFFKSASALSFSCLLPSVYYLSNKLTEIGLYVSLFTHSMSKNGVTGWLTYSSTITTGFFTHCYISYNKS